MSNLEAVAAVQSSVKEHFAIDEEGKKLLADSTESSTKALRKCMSEMIKGVKSNGHDQESRRFGKNIIQALEAYNPQSDLWTWDGYCKRLMLELKTQHDAYVITSKNGCVAERSHFGPGGRGSGRGNGGRGNQGRGNGGGRGDQGGEPYPCSACGRKGHAAAVCGYMNQPNTQGGPHPDVNRHGGSFF